YWLGRAAPAPRAHAAPAKKNHRGPPAAPAGKPNPAIVEIDTKEEVYSLGDVHGDYDRLVNVLLAARILKKSPSKAEKARWAAGKAVLVCTGDLIDKWDHSLPVLALMRALQAGAGQSGGRGVGLRGHH